MINFIEKIWRWYIFYFEKIAINYKIIILLLAFVMGICLFLCVSRKQLCFRKAIVVEILFCYLLLVLMSTVFSRESANVNQANIDIIHAYSYKLKYNIDTQFELLLNVLLLLPFGVLFPYITKSKKLIYTLIGGFLISLTIEVLQFVLKKGTFELTDIINNSLGVLVGYLIYVLVRKIKCVMIGRYDKKENNHV